MYQGLRLLGILSLGVCTLLLPGQAAAGTVFLKNGYVIQGDIVERADDGVVMQWPDGRMTIYDRFVADVIIDPTELAAIERRERLISDQEAVAKIAVQPVARRTVLRLPASIDEIMSPEHALAGSPDVTERRDPTAIDVPVVEVLEPLGAGDSDPGSAVEVAEIPPVSNVADPVSGAGHGGETHIAEIPNPVTEIEQVVPARTRELEFPELGFAIVPPDGWLVLEDADGVRLRPGSDQPFPSLNISVQLDAMAHRSDAGQVLEDILRQRFPGVEVLEVRQQQIGFERAFVIEGELPSKNLRFTQALIPHGDGHYLVGLQVENPSDDGVQRQLQRSLHSLRFLTQ